MICVYHLSRNNIENSASQPSRFFTLITLLISSDLRHAINSTLANSAPGGKEAVPTKTPFMRSAERVDACAPFMRRKQVAAKQRLFDLVARLDDGTPRIGGIGGSDDSGDGNGNGNGSGSGSGEDGSGDAEGGAGASSDGDGGSDAESDA